MILGTLLFYLGGIRVVELRIPAAILAWLVVVLQWPHCARSPRRQALTLLSIGAAALLFAYSKGIFPGWHQIFMVNLPMLAMFAAVAFLSLTTPAHPDANLPTGRSAPATTAIGTNLLGAVINLSIVLVFGDRLQHNNATQQHADTIPADNPGSLILCRGLVVTILYRHRCRVDVCAADALAPDCDPRHLHERHCNCLYCPGSETFWQGALRRLPH